MIDRIRGREVFRRLGSSAIRVRRGSLSVVFAKPTDDQRWPAVAFAVPSRVGNAVQRNRLRRQLREIARSLSRQGELPVGAYLVVVGQRAATASFGDLERQFSAAVTKIGSQLK